MLSVVAVGLACALAAGLAFRARRIALERVRRAVLAEAGAVKRAAQAEVA